MRERYDLDEMLKEIKKDERNSPRKNKLVSQNEIKKILEQKQEQKLKNTSV